MKKKNLILLALLLGTILLVNSCATQSVSKSYPEKWEKIYVGMSLEEFKQIFPEARGPFKDSQGNIQYTVSPPIIPFSYGTTKIAYFAFKDNKLTEFIEI